MPFYLRGYWQAKKRGWLVFKRGWLVFKRGWLASVFKRSGQAKGKSVEIKVSSQTEGFSVAQKTLIQLRPAREGNRVTETKTGSKSPNWLTSVQARISLRIRLNAWQSLCTSSEGQRVDLSWWFGSFKVEEGGDWNLQSTNPHRMHPCFQIQLEFCVKVDLELSGGSKPDQMERIPNRLCGDSGFTHIKARS